MFTLVSIEFKKIKRSKVLYIAIGTMILFYFCAAAQGIKTNYGADRLINETLTYATFFIVPALYSLLGCYVIFCEYQNDTMKNLRIIPVNQTKLIYAKLIATLIIGIFLFIALFMLTLLTAIFLNNTQIDSMLIFTSLKAYLLQSVGCFIAVLPVIVLMSMVKNGYWLSVIFSEIYSFSGIIAGSSNFRNIYPISAVFGFSGASSTSLTEYLVCCSSLCISLSISFIFLKIMRNKQGV